MGELPSDFVADLRHVHRWPGLDDSLWRAPHLVRLTYGRLWELVAEVLPEAPARILDVGSGSGAISLEMARAGHDVVALEPDEESIALARRTADGSAPGRLVYRQADVESWTATEADFDVVVTTRVLHHVPDPADAITRMRDWLRPGGRLVVVDFLYDRFDRRAAQWLAQVRSLLEAAGMFGPDDDRLPDDPERAVRRIEADWRKDHEIEHTLNRAHQILDPLHELLRPESESSHPYLYWDLLIGLHADDPATEEAVATRIVAWEQFLLGRDELPAILHRFVGTA